jgi:hypothetical protein
VWADIQTCDFGREVYPRLTLFPTEAKRSGGTFGGAGSVGALSDAAVSSPEGVPPQPNLLPNGEGINESAELDSSQRRKNRTTVMLNLIQYLCQ